MQLETVLKTNNAMCIALLHPGAAIPLLVPVQNAIQDTLQLPLEPAHQPRTAVMGVCLKNATTSLVCALFAQATTL